MPDLTTPTTRAERRAAVAAWRALPVRQRFAVLRSAKAGVRHPEASAATAAEAYARAALAPRGPHWWQRQMPEATASIMLVSSLALGGLSVWLFRLEGGGSTWGWVSTGIAAVHLVLAALAWDTARECRRILSVAPAEDGAGPHQVPSPGS